MTNEIHLQRAADAEVLDGDPGGTIALLADRAGTLTSNRSFMRAGSAGAPPHRHQRSAELFFVLDGALEVLLDDRIVTLEQRRPARRARRHARTPSPRPPTATPTSCSSSRPAPPASDYYRLLDRAYRGEAQWSEIAESSERFDNHYVESPLWQDALAREGEPLPRGSIAGGPHAASSGRRDLNSGPHRPERCALPGCATPRGDQQSSRPACR